MRMVDQRLFGLVAVFDDLYLIWREKKKIKLTKFPNLNYSFSNNHIKLIYD